MMKQGGVFPTTRATRVGSAHRGPPRREDYVRRVKEALQADYLMLRTSPLCDLPGVASLARGKYGHKIFPEASALRALLDRAYRAAVEELEDVEDHRLRQIHTYLCLAQEGKSITAITAELGLHSRSYVHREIQRQAIELITEAFLQIARQADTGDGGQ